MPPSSTLLNAAALLLPVLPRVHALPATHRRALGTGDSNNSGGNSASPKIIVPVVLAAVILLMLLVGAWWRRRRRLRQVVTDIRNNASTTNTSTPGATSTRTPITAPGTGPDAPPRPPRRRRRRRASQISTKSLPAYNEQAGDEEIVLVRRAERGSMSDDDDEDDDDENPGDSRISGHEPPRPSDATPLLDDTSPEMGQVSLASSTRGRSEGDQDRASQDTQTRPDTSMSLSTVADTTNDSAAPLPDAPETTATHVPAGDAPPYSETVRSSEEATGLGHGQSQSSEGGAGSSTAATGTSASASNAAEADALGTLRPKRKSVFRQFFALNRPGSTSSTAPPDSVEMAPTEARQSLSAAPATTTTTTTQGTPNRHRPSASISTLASSSRGHGHTLSPSLSSLLLTRSRSPTRSSDSLAQRMNISAPIPTTLIRTELSYPRSGPTPEQIRFLSSRESLGRFGMPYGEEAVAAAARSRDNISTMLSPPEYELGLGSSNATSEARDATVTPNSRRTGLSSNLAQAPMTGTATADEGEQPLSAEAPPGPTSPPHAREPELESVETTDQMSEAPTDQADLTHSASGSAMPTYDRRDSVLSTNSFVTANEGDRETVAEGDEEDDDSDSSPPTPTIETYRLAEDDTVRITENTGDTVRQTQTRPRGQTILIPGSQTGDDAHHPQLTVIPATPTVDVPVRLGDAA